MDDELFLLFISVMGVNPPSDIASGRIAEMLRRMPRHS